MRLALFRNAGQDLAVSLDLVLKVLQEPPVFGLPLLRTCFGKVLVFEDQVVPLVRSFPGVPEHAAEAGPPQIVLVCEAEFGRIGIPAEKVERITAPGERLARLEPEAQAAGGEEEIYHVSGQAYRLLNVNQLIEIPAI